MRTSRRAGNAYGYDSFDEAQTRVLSASEERTLLRDLHDCKKRLPAEGEGTAASRVDFDRYRELRTRLAMANVRLVAHVAKRYRDHGISDADLLQEGFCGLLEAIDRFDLSHGTKLGTYATWWIRQAMQRAVAEGAYPVRLSPRHLRLLAQNQDVLERGPGSPDAAGARPDAQAKPAPNYEMIHRIQTATRPAVSLDATAGGDGDDGFTLLQTLSDPERDHTDALSRNEALSRLLQTLRPREKEVVALRFGVTGQPRKSLSQVGKLLKVSKERIRQIQNSALAKLRAAADEAQINDLFLANV